MARRKKHEEHENHERWLVSYADFITLLFAFFVVMYAVSSVNEGKMRVLSDTLMATFYSRQKSLEPIQVGELVRSPYVDRVSPVTSPALTALPKTPDPGVSALGEDGVAESGEGEGMAEDETGEESGGAGQDGTEMAAVEGIATQVEASMAPLIEADLVEVRRKEAWLEVEFKTSILFGSGEARIASEAIPVIERLAEVLKRFPNPVQVEGFTDNVPIDTVAFPSNWELSAGRAASVVHLLARYGVRPERMSAIGYGEHRPVADNSTPEGRAQNRRVVLVIPADNKTRRLLDIERLANS